MTNRSDAIGAGSRSGLLTEHDVAVICDQALAQWKPDGKRVLFVVPDLSRTCPLDLMFRLLYERLAGRVKLMDFLIALGTHPPLTKEQIYKRMGITAAEHERRFPKARFFNHEWKNPDQLVEVGRFSKSDVREITEGRFEMDVSITCNRMVLDYDLLVIIGPVFPHEVVGFSGGAKYLFPGIAGQEIIDFFHWLGAVITNPVIIGNKWTPVRRVVDRAAAMLAIERKAFCMVVQNHDLAGLYAGTPEEAWSAAADLSSQIHTHYSERPFHTVLSCAPEMYDDLWTGGKCMYKIEPVVADGGKVIIYAPHITEISSVHGAILEKIGYHTRDFFLKQWDQYKGYPWGVVAHSTHVKGIGTYEKGVEKPRVEVILATRIPEAICRKVNLGYLDPRSIRIGDYENREPEGVLCVRRAGEILYRWKHAPAALGGRE
ncbi:MAG: lactate racemase domain-containing protein [bacterium]